MLKGKNIVLCVTGGIAAFKAVSIASGLVKKGARVDVIMTKHAQEFVTPLSFRSITKTPVVTDMFEEPKVTEIAHISLAQRADAFVIAPATANIIGKIAWGIADDMVSTTVMATKAPVIIVPAMNTNMYENPIVQENMARLKSHGYIFMEPDSGLLACGTSGAGRLPEPEAIVEMVDFEIGRPKDLKGIKVLVTAGPTREAIDPVRYITNGSTGKMGYAAAKAAAMRGAEVVLVSGPVNIPAPMGAEVVNVTTAEEMYEAVTSRSENFDIIIKTAAVADFRPASVSGDKIKKEAGASEIKLERTRDILAELGKNKTEGQVLAGFCMETRELIESAARKLKNKNLDIIAANDLNTPGAGFAADTNVVTLLFADGRENAELNGSKEEVADAILSEAAELLCKKRGGA